MSSAKDAFAEDTTCILCGQRARHWLGPDTRLECSVCGLYYLRTGADLALSEDESVRPFLSAATRQASERGKPITLTIDNYGAYADEHRWTSVQTKARKILEYLREKSSYFSHTVEFHCRTDYPLFDAVWPGECSGLMEMLDGRGYIIRDGRLDEAWKLSMDGWEALEPLHAGSIPGRCFVAMAFDAKLDDAFYHGIKPAIEEAGYDPICLKERPTNENICDVMLAEIRKAQFIVADFTMQKGGVYFEAGFAKALGKEVFWTCREDDFKNLHFDTNHYGHLKWSTPENLKRELLARIVAEIGVGPHPSRRPTS
jgi:hypothetical protein